MADSSKGNELRFADDAGRSLPYEIETWDPKGTSLVWVKIPALAKGTNLTAYANGVKVFEAPIAAVKDTDNKLAFGARDRAVVRGHFTGLFDEFRLRDAVSTADWVKAEYDQSEATFLTSSPPTQRK